MLGFLWRMLVGRFKSAPACEHKWKMEHEYNIVDEYERVKGSRFVLRCEKCGEITKRNV